jgi:hypothetical protein
LSARASGPGRALQRAIRDSIDALRLPSLAWRCLRHSKVLPAWLLPRQHTCTS